jgi:putative CocE/NonD family hydrolase
MKTSGVLTGMAVAIRAALSLLLCFFVGLSPVWGEAPDLEFHPPSLADEATVPAVMRDLAERLLPVYQEADPDRYLANLSVLQMVAGDYAAADVSRQSLRDRRRTVDAGRPVGRAAIYDIYAYAMALQADSRVSFADAFTRSFREVIARLNDHDAYAVTRWLAASPTVYREALQKAFDRSRSGEHIGQSDAMDLIRTYLSFEAYRTFAPFVDSLVTEDDRRRYSAEDDVLIETKDGAHIAAVVVRPKSPSKPLPTLFEFTIDASRNDAKECAAHGYIGVVAYTRGVRGSSDKVVPYQHDGDDARAVIAWIARQPWSDGRVGMYGEGYGGFTPWAAAKNLPPALKAIATSAAGAPGIDFPMAGNIFHNSAYRWSSYVTDANPADDPGYHDEALWRALDQKWYRSGRRYRDLGRLHGKANPIFIRWLNHPSYDRYWQEMVPYREQFAHITIPVLTTTGYFADSEPGALYFFAQHIRYNPHADHTLLIGPFDDGAMQRAPAPMLRGYQPDAAALLDLRELRYQWFDHVLKAAVPPPLLKSRVNYEVMGANEWRHAASLDAMAKGPLRFYLDATGSGDAHRLALRRNPTTAIVRQTLNFADRSDAGWLPSGDLVSATLAGHNDVVFVSEPLTKQTEVSGLFSARLDFTVNKMDMDLHIDLYERRTGGDYVRLFSPGYDIRASYAQDRVHRHLLKAGERQQLTIKSERLTSRQLQPGSRLVMVLGISKRPDREINYGTGNDVSDESVADGKISLKIHWYNDSYIDIPIRR